MTTKSFEDTRRSENRGEFVARCTLQRRRPPANRMKVERSTSPVGNTPVLSFAGFRTIVVQRHFAVCGATEERSRRRVQIDVQERKSRILTARTRYRSP